MNRIREIIGKSVALFSACCVLLLANGDCLEMRGLLANRSTFSMAILKPYNTTAWQMFHSADRDHNGVVTKLETEATFRRYDTNGNGVLSREEYTEEICAESPILYHLSHYMYDEFDSDHDHHLEQHDYDTFFDRIDTNKDGQLTEDEYVAFFVQVFLKYESVTIHGHANPNSVCHGNHG